MPPLIFKKGDTFGVYAPSAPLHPQRFADGIQTVRELGFNVRCPLDPSTTYGSYSYGFGCASVEERVKSLHDLARASDIQTLIATRGAYGALDLLPQLDLELLANCGKPIIGYSDVCAVLLALFSRGASNAVHGPVLGREFADYSRSSEARESVDFLLRMLSEDGFSFTRCCETLRAGCAEGPLVATNLTLLQTLMATPWEVDLDGAILVLEEVGEAPYRVARSLWQLRQGGVFKNLAGVVFGRFSRCVAAHGPTIEEILRASVEQSFDETRCPILLGLPVGHDGLNYAMPLGALARIEEGVFSYRA